MGSRNGLFFFIVHILELLGELMIRKKLASHGFITMFIFSDREFCLLTANAFSTTIFKGIQDVGGRVRMIYIRNILSYLNKVKTLNNLILNLNKQSH